MPPHPGYDAGMTRFAAAAALLAHLCLAPGGAAASDGAAAPERSVEAKSQDLLDGWKARFDAEGFNYVVSAPFVIAGDGGRARIRRYRDGTILAAARALKAMYFKTEPDEPVLILLFEKAHSYKRYARTWFGDATTPHYGYFRRADRVMLMNVGTGTGTLVHELVHALIAPDFPDVPDWFNEGLASLYEQCRIEGDRITGLANWRLPALQRAIRSKALRPLTELMRDESFYDRDRVALNYAQARYLLLYLQEKGLLEDYYARFRENVGDDPSGLETLKAVIGPQELEAFEVDWHRWVLRLRFRR